jgi:hypothetical protein
MTTTMNKTRNEANRESLAFMKSEGLLVGTSLVFNVEKKVRKGAALTTVEQGILTHGVTNAQLRFIKQHLL